MYCIGITGRTDVTDWSGALRLGVTTEVSLLGTVTNDVTEVGEGDGVHFCDTVSSCK